MVDSEKFSVRLEYLAYWRTLAWLLLAAVILLSILPSGVPSGIEGGDKIQHLLAYWVLAFCFATLYPRQRAVALIGLLLLGFLLEFFQGLLPTRDASLADGIADSLGVGLGLWVSRSRAQELFRWLEARFMSG